jgi:hypothetical protein
MGQPMTPAELAAMCAAMPRQATVNIVSTQKTFDGNKLTEYTPRKFWSDLLNSHRLQSNQETVIADPDPQNPGVNLNQEAVDQWLLSFRKHLKHYLVDTADLWYDNEVEPYEHIYGDYDTLHDAFINHYESGTVRRDLQTEAYAIKMMVGESLPNFQSRVIDSVRKGWQGRHIEVQNDNIQRILVQGLIPKILQKKIFVYANNMLDPVGNALPQLPTLVQITAKIKKEAAKIVDSGEDTVIMTNTIHEISGKLSQMMENQSNSFRPSRDQTIRSNTNSQPRQQTPHRSHERQRSSSTGSRNQNDYSDNQVHHNDYQNNDNNDGNRPRNNRSQSVAEKYNLTEDEGTNVRNYVNYLYRTIAVKTPQQMERYDNNNRRRNSQNRGNNNNNSNNNNYQRNNNSNNSGYNNRSNNSNNNGYDNNNSNNGGYNNNNSNRSSSSNNNNSNNNDFDNRNQRGNNQNNNNHGRNNNNNNNNNNRRNHNSRGRGGQRPSGNGILKNGNNSNNNNNQDNNERFHEISIKQESYPGAVSEISSRPADQLRLIDKCVQDAYMWTSTLRRNDSEKSVIFPL